MLDINHAFDSLDLRTIHFVLSFVGIFLCAFAMQMLSTSGAPLDVMPVFGTLRRIGIWALALSMCWNVGYADIHARWQPWPCDVMMVLALDFYMLVSIIGAYVRQRMHAVH
jgi:predicted membrane protein